MKKSRFSQIVFKKDICTGRLASSRSSRRLSLSKAKAVEIRYGFDELSRR
jgi:hypothetical protein